MFHRGTHYVLLKGAVAGNYDADAQAFFDAAGITDTTQKNAVNQLVLDLKSYSIWSKMSAVYPFVGGTASTHKWNLKDARDLDAAFRLVFTGSWTHNSNGVTGDGSTAYADTKLAPSAVLGQDSKHLSAWAKSTLNNCLAGAWSSSQNFRDHLQHDGTIITGNLSINGFFFGPTHTASTGLYSCARTSSTSEVVYRNGSSLLATNITSGANPSTNYYLGARNGSGTAEVFSNTNLAFASIGSGLTDAEMSNLYTAVNAFQTTLGR